MTTYLFSDLIWNKTNLIIRGNSSYRLYYLLVELSEPDTSDTTMDPVYLIKHNRTHALICRVVVPLDQFADFKRFQNALVVSKLDVQN